MITSTDEVIYNCTDPLHLLYHFFLRFFECRGSLTIIFPFSQSYFHSFFEEDYIQQLTNLNITGDYINGKLGSKIMQLGNKRVGPAYRIRPLSSDSFRKSFRLSMDSGAFEALRPLSVSACSYHEQEQHNPELNHITNCNARRISRKISKFNPFVTPKLNESSDTKRISSPFNCSKKTEDHFDFGTSLIVMNEANNHFYLPKDLADGHAKEVIRLLKKTIKSGQQRSAISPRKLKIKLSLRSLKNQKQTKRHGDYQEWIGSYFITTDYNKELIRNLAKEINRLELELPTEEYMEIVQRYKNNMNARVSDTPSLLEEMEPITDFARYCKRNAKMLMSISALGFVAFWTIATSKWDSMNDYERVRDSAVSIKHDHSFSDRNELQRFIDQSSIESLDTSDIEDALIDFSVNLDAELNPANNHFYKIQNTKEDKSHPNKNTNKSPDSNKDVSKMLSIVLNDDPEFDAEVKRTIKDLSNPQATRSYRSYSTSSRNSASEINKENEPPNTLNIYEDNPSHYSDSDRHSNDFNEENVSKLTDLSKTVSSSSNFDHDNETEGNYSFDAHGDYTDDTTIQNDFTSNPVIDAYYEECVASKATITKPKDLSFIDIPDSGKHTSTPSSKMIGHNKSRKESGEENLTFSSKIDKFEKISGGKPKSDSFWVRLAKFNRYYLGKQAGQEDSESTESSEPATPNHSLKKAKKKRSFVLPKTAVSTNSLIPPNHPAKEAKSAIRIRSVKERLGDLLDTRLNDMGKSSEFRDKIVHPQHLYERFANRQGKIWQSMSFLEREPYYLAFRRCYCDIIENFDNYDDDIVEQVAEVCLEFGEDCLPIVMSVISRSP